MNTKYKVTNIFCCGGKIQKFDTHTRQYISLQWYNHTGWGTTPYKWSHDIGVYTDLNKQRGPEEATPFHSPHPPARTCEPSAVRGAITRLEYRRVNRGGKYRSWPTIWCIKCTTNQFWANTLSTTQIQSGTGVRRSTQIRFPTHKPDSQISDRQVYSKYTKLVWTVQMYTAHKVYTGTFKQVWRITKYWRSSSNTSLTTLGSHNFSHTASH